MRIEQSILEQARARPEARAIEADSVAISYGQLDALSKTWSLQLARAGVQQGQPVWLFLPNCPEFVIACMAILRAGCVLVPINPRLGGAELRHIARLCPPCAVWSHDRLLNRILAALSESARPHIVRGNLGSGLLIEPSPHAGAVPRLVCQNGTPGLVYFTSGSTGRPKGILLTHSNIASNYRAAAETFGLTAGDRTLVCMQMCHSYTLTKQVLAHLSVGATLVLAPDFFQPAVVLRLAEQNSVTTLFAVPSMHVMLYEQLRRSPLPLAGLRLLVTGGAPMPGQVQIGLQDRLRHVSFVSSYGLSEASPFVAALPARWAATKVGSIGMPVCGVQLMICDEADRPVNSGMVGELCVRGSGVMAGYLGDEESTARVLRGGWLHTGDLARQDEDGCVLLAGRRDDLILRGGENVYPVEIENTLYGHDAVFQAAAIGVPHPVLGQDILAYVTLRPGTRVEPDELRSHCSKHLSSFKVPREVKILESLPLTSNGKIAHSVLRSNQGIAC